VPFASTSKYGADGIKTCASGGVPSPTDDVDVPQLSQAELNALVDEAVPGIPLKDIQEWEGRRKPVG
jgi:hypothetical protein